MDLAFSPDGWRLASASVTGSVDVWDVAAGAHLATAVRFEGPAVAVDFSQDGTRLLAADGKRGLIHLCNSGKLKRIRSLSAGARVFAARFLPGWQGIVASSPDGIVILSPTGERLATLVGPRNEVLALALDPTGTRLVASGFDGRVFVYNTSDGSQVANLAVTPGHVVRCVGIAPDGRWIAAGSVSQPNDVYLWGPGADGPLRRLSGHQDSVHALVIDSAGTLITADYRGVVWEWDPLTGTAGSRGPAHSGHVKALSWTDDGNLLSVGPWSTDSSSARLWDLDTGDSTAIAVRSVSASAGDQLAVHEEEGIFLRGLTPAKGVALADTASDQHRGGAFAHRTRRYAHLGSESVGLFDTGSGRRLRRWSYADTPNAVAFSADDRMLAVGGYDNRVRLFAVDDDTPGLVLEGHKRAVQAVAWAPDGQRPVSGGEDGRVIVWDAEDGRAIRVSEASGRGTWAVDWSPDGTRIAAAGLDGVLILWDAASGQETARYSGHPGFLFATAFSPDSRVIASAGDDETILLWD
ncbi:MAG: WD40 repeat protein [Myxococcota bacterium]